jgi:uncharacterized protein with GYD domain
MLNACILIKVVPVKADFILKAIRGVTEVKKAYFVYGRFDVVAFLEAVDYKNIREISGRVNSIDGVRSTETLVEA